MQASKGKEVCQKQVCRAKGDAANCQAFKPINTINKLIPGHLASELGSFVLLSGVSCLGFAGHLVLVLLLLSYLLAVDI
jgi:hypothetical protein